MVLFQIGFQGLDHSDDFFLAHFLAAAESVFVRAVVEQCVGDQIFFADKKTGALGPANRFSTTESDQVVTHFCVVPQMRDRRRICCGVDECREAVFMRQLDPFLDFDLAVVISKVGEVHHGGLRGDGFFQIFTRINNHQFHAGGTQLMVEGITV